MNLCAHQEASRNLRQLPHGVIRESVDPIFSSHVPPVSHLYSNPAQCPLSLQERGHSVMSLLKDSIEQYTVHCVFVSNICQLGQTT